MVICVGGARNVLKRVCTDHCTGNVEGSKMRERIAEAKGFSISKMRRSRSELNGLPTGPGVCVFHHERLPAPNTG